jgi:hypothetical protein
MIILTNVNNLFIFFKCTPDNLTLTLNKNVKVESNWPCLFCDQGRFDVLN